MPQNTNNSTSAEESRRMKEAERALRAKIKGFRAGTRMTRDLVHERGPHVERAGLQKPEV